MRISRCPECGFPICQQCGAGELDHAEADFTPVEKDEIARLREIERLAMEMEEPVEGLSKVLDLCAQYETPLGALERLRAALAATKGEK